MENTQTGDVKMPITYEDLKQSLVDSGRPYDFDMIDRAYALAEKAHGGQRRRSGEPYICHPLSVASILVELGMDSESIAAALMHDMAEDTPVTVAEIKQKFGPDVALLVDGVTKLTQIKFSNVEDRQAENLRKMLLAMSQDVRVMIIKLCDRLHNMRTGDAWPEQKRRDKALETMEVYAPIAHRLGISNIKEELEDRSLHYLDPVGYEDHPRPAEQARRRVPAHGLPHHCQASGGKRYPESHHPPPRQEHLRHLPQDVYAEQGFRGDLRYLRRAHHSRDMCPSVITRWASSTTCTTRCPTALKITSLPQSQYGYQSPAYHRHRPARRIPFEVQIRTWEMDQHGRVRHRRPLEVQGRHQHGSSDKLDERLAWVRQLLESQSDPATMPATCVSDIKSDLLPEEVFAFTPQGRRHQPARQVPPSIDFAYAIHSAVGNRMIGAKVNSRIVPIDSSRCRPARSSKSSPALKTGGPQPRLAEHCQDQRGQEQDPQLVQERTQGREYPGGTRGTGTRAAPQPHVDDR